MIEELKVRGFRSLKDVTWHPGALNVIIGPNGSGKSNLLRAIEILGLSAYGRLSRMIAGEGGIEAILWDGYAPSARFAVVISNDAAPDDYTKTLSYDFVAEKTGVNRYSVVYEKLEVSNADTLLFTSLYGKSFPLIHRENDNAHVVWQPLDPTGNGIFMDKTSSEETILSQLSGPLMPSTTIRDFKRTLESFAIYQDILVHRDSPVRKPVIARFEKSLNANAGNLVEVLHTLYSEDRDFKQDVNRAMSAAFGQDFEELIFPPAADQRIQMRVRWKTLKREQSAADLSDGTLRFLFLIAVLANPDPPLLIAIDEPEAGLHPSMLPIIAEYAVNASLRTQVVFTTHSDQFLDAFTETKPTTTVAKWENGETTLTTLDGQALQFWLEDYTLGALYRSGELESGAIA